MMGFFIFGNKMTISFSDSYKIEFQVYDALGALDPILGIDTRLFIDPLLVKNTKIPEFKTAASKIEIYFDIYVKCVVKTSQWLKNSLKSQTWELHHNFSANYSIGIENEILRMVEV